MFPVKDLVVDSVNGYLYWATMYSVESTRLNGEEYLMLQEQLQFSGKQVTDFFTFLSFCERWGGGVVCVLIFRPLECSQCS